jgi:hypothetical protein
MKSNASVVFENLKKRMNSKALPSILLLPSRLLLFLIFQLCAALIIGSIEQSAKYWILSASVTNVISIAALIYVQKLKGLRFLDLFTFDKTSFKKDISVFLGITLVCGPVVFLPNYYLSLWLWGDPSIPYNMLFKPIPLPMVYVLLILFPITIAFAELATYFGYIMPMLKSHLERKWLAVLLPVLFLSAQHCTLPFLPDFKFLLYRLLMYFPFACLIGITLYKRPKLFSYFAIMHGLLDFGTVIVLLEISKAN